MGWYSIVFLRQPRLDVPDADFLADIMNAKEGRAVGVQHLPKAEMLILAYRSRTPKPGLTYVSVDSSFLT